MAKAEKRSKEIAGKTTNSKGTGGVGGGSTVVEMTETKRRGVTRHQGPFKLSPSP